MYPNYLKYSKWGKRIGIVIGNSARNIIPQILNSLLSLLVIKFSSFSEWGTLVTYLLIFNLYSQFIVWGSKQYLLREFAANPANVKQEWFENIKARVLLLGIGVIAITIMPITLQVKQILIIWLIINYISRSYDVLIIYYKKISFFLMLEISLSIIFLYLVFLKQQAVNTIFILSIFLFVEVTRLAVTAYYFKEIFSFKKEWKIDFKVLGAGSLIFLLGIIGMIQTRLDLYFVAILLPKNELAIYQVLLNFIIIVQASTGFLIQPFLKTIYRLGNESISKISIRFTLAGIITAIPISLFIKIILAQFYKTEIDWQMMLLTYFYIVPIFYYTIRIYLLYKMKRESVILISGTSVLLLSIPLNYYLIHLMGNKGALIAGVSGELLSLCFYHFLEKKSERIFSRRQMQAKLEFNER